MIDSHGHVLATVFAAITNAGRADRGGFAVPNALVRAQLSSALARDRVVGTGTCGG
jgi:hypothetical protein